MTAMSVWIHKRTGKLYLVSPWIYVHDISDIPLAAGWLLYDGDCTEFCPFGEEICYENLGEL